MSQGYLGHVSQNRVQGSLSETPLAQVLGACRRSLVTGSLSVHDSRHEGKIELRAGSIETAAYGAATGELAVLRMQRLSVGEYELAQKLPTLDGSLGDGAAFEGELSDISLVEIMRHCEQHALTCQIVTIHDFDRGTIDYRAGEITCITHNGEADEDHILHMTPLGHEARFRVSALPLAESIQGWPVVRRAPTVAFRLLGDHPAPGPRPATSGPSPMPGCDCQKAPRSRIGRLFGMCGRLCRLIIG